MPELPEVETIRRQLMQELIGSSFVDVRVLMTKSLMGEVKLILNSPLVSVERRGKYLIFGFENGCGMLVHLKMSGQLRIIEEKEDLADEAEKYARIKFKIDSGRELWFCDMRRFGWVKILNKHQMKTIEAGLGLGLEPLSRDFTAEKLAEILNHRPNRRIKTVLLDQTAIAGIGNIYSDEALFAARILPCRPAGSLTVGEVVNLRETIQEVLERSLALGGSSMQMYVQVDGSRGNYLDDSFVYGREGQLCRRCNEGVIIRQKIAGRSSYFCPVCQS